MTWTQTLGALCFLCFVAWNTYECFRMRQHRKSSEYILHLVTVNLEKMLKRQDAAFANDATTARTLEQIEQRLSRPANPADGVRP